MAEPEMSTAPPQYASKEEEAAASGEAVPPAYMAGQAYPPAQDYPTAQVYPRGQSYPVAMQAQPLVGAPVASQPVTFVNTSGTAPSTDDNPHYVRRTEQTLKVVLSLMVVVGFLGAFMFLSGCYLAGERIEVEYIDFPGTHRRDWYQGIWAGLTYLTMTVVTLIFFWCAKVRSFKLETTGLRPWAYLLITCLFCLMAFAFALMIMCAITAGTLSANNDYNCQHFRSTTEPCVCGSIVVKNADCDLAFGPVYALYTAMAVMNAVIIILAVVAGSFLCAGSCFCCGQGTIVAQPGMTVVYPIAQPIAGQPITVAQPYPGQPIVAQPL